MANKTISGKQVTLYYATKGTKVTTGTLIASTWYLIDALGAVSGLDSDLKVKNIFKSKPTAMETLGTGDEVYPLTLVEICRGDIDQSLSKGNIDVTDSCADGINQYITDGFSDLSGSIKAFLKFDSATGALNSVSEEFLKRFMPIFKDNAAGTIAKTAQTDDEVILFIRLDKTKTVATEKQLDIIMSAIINDITLAKPLKGVQGLDISFSAGQDVLPCIYERLVV